MRDTPTPPSDSPAPKAQHGWRNEVSWDGGTGRQPYANQDGAGAPSPGAAEEVPEGNRRDHSGQTLEQFEQARGTPP